MGWIGTMHQLTYALKMFNCDHDAQGRPCVDGSISTFMGDTSDNAEVVVGDDAVYYVNGQPRNIAQTMKATSYGMNITVIS